MDVTKIILRKSNATTLLPTEKVHLVSREGDPDANAARLSELAADYRTFKALNPSRSARLPAGLKLKARELVADGVSLHSLAAACGIAYGTAFSWMGRHGIRAKNKAKGTRTINDLIGLQVPLSQSSPVRASGPDASEATDSAAANPEATLSLAELAQAYKAFKATHPENWMRLPQSFKSAARALVARGHTAQALAAACAVSHGTVLAWIRVKKSAAADEARVAEVASGDLQPGWIRVRIRGIDVDLTEDNFRRLILPPQAPTPQ